MAYCENCGNRFDGAGTVCGACATGAPMNNQVDPMAMGAAAPQGQTDFNQTDAFMQQQNAYQQNNAYDPNQAQFGQQGGGNMNQPPNYGAPNQGGYGQPQYVTHTSDNGSFGWGLLGCCIPVVGLILFLVWKGDRPKTAKMAGIGALIGTGISVVTWILSLVLGFMSY